MIISGICAENFCVSCVPCCNPTHLSMWQPQWHSVCSSTVTLAQTLSHRPVVTPHSPSSTATSLDLTALARHSRPVLEINMYSQHQVKTIQLKQQPHDRKFVCLGGRFKLHQPTARSKSILEFGKILMSDFQSSLPRYLNMYCPRQEHINVKCNVGTPGYYYHLGRSWSGQM